jgi:hypothetical protein
LALLSKEHVRLTGPPALADAFAAVHDAVGGTDVGYMQRLSAAQQKTRAR